MTNLNPEPRPFALMREIDRRYPGLWEVAKAIRNEKGHPSARMKNWAGWCFLPLQIWHSLIMFDKFRDGQEMNESIMAEVVSIEALVAAAVCAWRINKAVCKFGESLYSELINAPIPDDMLIRIFFNLPDYCVYIETPGLFLQGREVYGFYAFLEDEYWDNSRELRLLYDCESGCFFPLTLALPEGWRFRAAFNRIYLDELVIEQALRDGSGGVTREEVVLEAELLRDFAAKTLSLLLHVCSDDANEAPDDE